MVVTRFVMSICKTENVSWQLDCESLPVGLLGGGGEFP
jgi:hypothetical protein